MNQSIHVIRNNMQSLERVKEILEHRSLLLQLLIIMRLEETLKRNLDFIWGLKLMRELGEGLRINLVRGNMKLMLFLCIMLMLRRLLGRG